MIIPQFTTNPPPPAWKGSRRALSKHVRLLVCSMARILWQTIIPFRHRPEEPQSTDVPGGHKIDDEQVDLCQAIFDQAEVRREHLEKKAQWSFTVVVFLTPLLASIFIFLLRNLPVSTMGYNIAIVPLVISGICLLLGFISIARAISIKERETLFLGAVIDPETRKFRKYNKIFRAKGLLYCAAMNTAMNDHIAQFVKGAHVFLAIAVIVLFFAAVPAGIAYTSHTSSPAQTSIAESVIVASAQFKALRRQIEEFEGVLARSEDNQIMRDQLQLLRDRITELDARLTAVEKMFPTSPQNSPVGDQKNWTTPALPETPIPENKGAE